MQIKRYKNVVNSKEINKINVILYSLIRFWRFQTSRTVDPENQKPFLIGILEISEINYLLGLFQPYIQDYLNEFPQKVKFERAYLNAQFCYQPGDWHSDNETGFTVLYYPDNGIDFGDEAGLEFKDHGVEKYISNSLIIFPANIAHRSLEHSKHDYRFSIAFKYL